MVPRHMWAFSRFLYCLLFREISANFSKYSVASVSLPSLEHTNTLKSQKEMSADYTFRKQDYQCNASSNYQGISAITLRFN